MSTPGKKSEEKGREENFKERSRNEELFAQPTYVEWRERWLKAGKQRQSIKTERDYERL